MSIETLENLILQYLSFCHPYTSFAWQGGEPLLMGLDFFEQAMNLMKKHAKPGHMLGNSIQTNGISIDKNWAEFFHQYNFLVGISLDGPEDIHNRFRTNSFKKVMKAIDLFKQYHVEYNILTVVSKSNVNCVQEVYKFFRKNKFEYLQFIPCIEETEEKQKTAAYTISAEKYGRFICQLFDEWLKDGCPEVHVRLFDNILEYYLGQELTNCQFKEYCGSYVVVEYNGDIYLCDFFVYPEWKIGNITEKSLSEIVSDEKFQEFSKKKSFLSQECKNCKWKSICHGGCSRTRFFCKKSFTDLDFFCSSYKMFFEHTTTTFEKLAKQIKGGKLCV